MLYLSELILIQGSSFSKYLLTDIYFTKLVSVMKFQLVIVYE